MGYFFNAFQVPTSLEYKNTSLLIPFLIFNISIKESNFPYLQSYSSGNIPLLSLSLSLSLTHIQREREREGERKLKRKDKVQKGIYWLIIPKIHADAAHIFIWQ